MMYICALNGAGFIILVLASWPRCRGDSPDVQTKNTIMFTVCAKRIGILCIRIFKDRPANELSRAVLCGGVYSFPVHAGNRGS